MKQKKIILAVLVVLIFISLYYGFFKNKGYQEDLLSIQLKDTSKITSFTVELLNEKVIVARNNYRWKVNNTYHANEFIIKRLLRIFKNLNVSILSRKDSIDILVQKLKDTGTKIEFKNNTNTVETYWIGEYNPEKKATLLMNSDRIPVYATSPGLSSNIIQFVEVDDIFWRNKKIFDFKPNEVTSVELTDYQNKNFSFRINIDDDNYQLFNTNNKPTEFDPEKIARYLSYYSNIQFESIEESFSQNQIDSILHQNPIYNIIVKFKDSNSLNLKLIQKSINSPGKEVDINNVYGLINNKLPLVVISYFSIDPLLKSITYFEIDK